MIIRSVFSKVITFINVTLILIFTSIILYTAITKYLKIQKRQKLNILSTAIQREFKYPKVIICNMQSIDNQVNISFEEIMLHNSTPNVVYVSQNEIKENILDPKVREVHNISQSKEEILNSWILLAKPNSIRHCKIISAPLINTN